MLEKINLTLVRHGQSEWNKKNLFTGWIDIGLTDEGILEAKNAGQQLKKNSIVFDVAFSSVLKRSIHTLDYVLKELDATTIPQIKAWQLNERHYGDLQGKNKQDLVDKYGKQQVQKWRRDYFTKPPLLTKALQPSHKEDYKGLKKFPLGESLKDTKDRVLPFWKKSIYPFIQKQKAVLIVAHGNSLRSLIKYLENISNEDISSVEIQTGKPIVYELNKEAKILNKKIF